MIKRIFISPGRIFLRRCILECCGIAKIPAIGHNGPGRRAVKSKLNGILGTETILGRFEGWHRFFPHHKRIDADTVFTAIDILCNQLGFEYSGFAKQIIGRRLVADINFTVAVKIPVIFAHKTAFIGKTYNQFSGTTLGFAKKTGGCVAKIRFSGFKYFHTIRRIRIGKAVKFICNNQLRVESLGGE